jgi:hypothetical protein
LQVSELQQQLQQAQQENTQLLTKLSEWGVASRRASVMGDNLSMGSAAPTDTSAASSAITSPNLSSVNGQIAAAALTADMVRGVIKNPQDIKINCIFFFFCSSSLVTSCCLVCDISLLLRVSAKAFLLSCKLYGVWKYGWPPKFASLC